MNAPRSRHPLTASAEKYRAALSQRGFRALWLAALVSRTGDTLNFVALALFTLAITNSAAAVGTVVLAEGVGLILGAVVAQLVVDQISPRPLPISVDMARAVTAALLASAPSYATALGVAFVLALGGAVFSPSSSALVPRLFRASCCWPPTACSGQRGWHCS